MIELGEYPETGLSYAQGEAAKTSLIEALRIVLTDGYEPPSPLNVSKQTFRWTRLPLTILFSSEMSRMRQTLEEIEALLRRPRIATSSTGRAEIEALRWVGSRNQNFLDEADFEMLTSDEFSAPARKWVQDLKATWEADRVNADGSYREEPPF